MNTKEEIKKYILSLGVDMVGFADLSRFDQAPEGFAPADALNTCKTVISFAIAFPRGGSSRGTDGPACRDICPFCLSGEVTH